MSVPVERITEKLDAFLGKKDYESAEKHLLYWSVEADAEHDIRGKLSVLNELIGLYRKICKKDEGIAACETALRIAKENGYEDSITMGTVCLNAATAYKSFDMAEKALPLYESALKLYEKYLGSEDFRLAGLYNNMALTVMSTGDYERAEKLFESALEILAKRENSEAEMAVTYCNMADLSSAIYDDEEAERKISEYLKKAEDLLNTDTLRRNGYYAFICEKCSPTFGFYGYFAFEAELKERAKKIYEGN